MYKPTKKQVNRWTKNYRRKSCNASTLRYEKTPKGFLMRKYRNMQSRVLGIQKVKFHLYKGLKVLPREDFYKWSDRNPSFLRLFEEWKASGYDRKLCPSVNRIDSRKGYEIPNMEWITHSENSRLTSRLKLKI